MIQNMRDLGGLKTVDRKVIRPGMLIRSAHLFQAEPRDLEGISAVIDLRTPGERREAPDQVHGRIYHPLPIFDDLTAGISHEEGTDTVGIPDLSVLYGRLMKECTASFRRVLLAVMEHDFSAGAILWHCTEGKDRCGMTSALVLQALGVDRDTILADYLKTNLVNLPKAIRMREKLLPTHGEAFADRMYQAYIADERYIRAAWEAMGENYLTETLGIPVDILERFRKTVLEEAEG